MRVAPFPPPPRSKRLCGPHFSSSVAGKILIMPFYLFGYLFAFCSFQVGWFPHFSVLLRSVSRISKKSWRFFLLWFRSGSGSHVQFYVFIFAFHTVIRMIFVIVRRSGPCCWCFFFQFPYVQSRYTNIIIAWVERYKPTPPRARPTHSTLFRCCCRFFENRIERANRKTQSGWLGGGVGDEGKKFFSLSGPWRVKVLNLHFEWSSRRFVATQNTSLAQLIRCPKCIYLDSRLMTTFPLRQFVPPSFCSFSLSLTLFSFSRRKTAKFQQFFSNVRGGNEASNFGFGSRSFLCVSQGGSSTDPHLLVFFLLLHKSKRVSTNILLRSCLSLSVSFRLVLEHLKDFSRWLPLRKIQ